MAQAKIFVVFFAFCMILPSTVVVGLPEQGVWNIQMTEKDQYIALTKSMYNQSKISVKILCDANDKEDPPKISIMWVLRWTPCAQEYIGIETQQARISHYLYQPTENQIGYEYKFAVFQQYETKEPITCGSHEPITLKDLSSEPYDRKPVVPLPGTSNNNTKQPQAAGSADHPSTTASKVDVDDGSKEGGDQESDKKDDKEGKPARRKRQADATAKTSTQPSTKATTQGPASPKSTTPKSAKMVPGKADDTVVATTWEDGVWLFALGIDPQGVGSKYNATVTIKMIGPNGYLSAIDWPLLPFYGSMCFVYVFYGIAWMVLIACNWRDILRIQFWIGGVIFLGMLEKAVFFAEYESINATGLSGITMPRYRTGAIMFRGAVVFAELVSCLKRTVARMLVIIVSLGFGIVKPRLGPMLHRVLAVGFLYFVLGSIEGCLRVLRAKGDVSNQLLLASIPLAVLDAAICWWIFTSLVQTTRTLRLRRNLVKLSLYRHFTNTLIFTVLASVVFMIWSIKQHKLTNCLTDWKEIWVDEAFWHLLFSVMLLVIMILWRPTNNNQRYAFSPLLDAADEDDEANEPMMNDAFDGMKLRGGKTKIEYPDSPSRDAKSKAEEDLKWIEENIPASVADTALPSLLDSDEEIMTTKFEMSKME